MVDTQPFCESRGIVGVFGANHFDQRVDLFLAPCLQFRVLAARCNSEILVISESMSSHATHKGQGTTHNDNDGVSGGIREKVVLECLFGMVKSEMRWNSTLGREVVDSLLLYRGSSRLASTHGIESGALDHRAKRVHLDREYIILVKIC
jgi:hypothetical protein